MTATSAQSANGTPSTANSLALDLVESLRTVQLPGSPATYANRVTLRGMGLRWDPVGHRWHGTTTAARVRELRERLYLEVRVFGVLEGAPKGPTAPKPAPLGPVPGPVPVRIAAALPTRDSGRRLHDGSRTRVEARVAFPTLDEDAEEIATPTRRFSLLEITSGLPDDSREADEREEARRLRDLRGCVKAARAAISAAPGADEVLRQNPVKAAWFYAFFGITENQFRQGAPASEGPTGATAVRIRGTQLSGARIKTRTREGGPRTSSDMSKGLLLGDV